MAIRKLFSIISSLLFVGAVLLYSVPRVAPRTDAALNYSDSFHFAPINIPSTMESNRFTNMGFSIENDTEVDLTNHYLTFFSEKLILTNVSVSFTDGRKYVGEFYSQPNTNAKVFFTEKADVSSYANVPFATGTTATYSITIKTDPAITNQLRNGDSVNFAFGLYGNTANGTEYTTEVPFKATFTISRLNELLQPSVPPTPSISPSAVPTQPGSTNAPSPSPTVRFITPSPTPVSNDSIVITYPGQPGGNGGTTSPSPTATPDMGNLGGLKLEIPGGNSVEFKDNVDLSKLGNVNDLKQLVILNETGKVTVDFGKLEGINRRAQITMKNIFFADENFSILKDGKDASRYISDVAYDKEKGILTFTAREMGKYEVVAGAPRNTTTAASSSDPRMKGLLITAGGATVLALVVFGHRFFEKKNNGKKSEEDVDEYKSNVV